MANYNQMCTLKEKLNKGNLGVQYLSYSVDVGIFYKACTEFLFQTGGLLQSELK